MLEINKITKVYKTADFTQKALDGVSIKFRKNEFVSILGQSGSGKTTLLNIIGGLDHYTSGDLIINNISTKKYTDRDWDTYRNHRVGFIFQSYNLIMHQTILKNVELALTLSGVPKSIRTKKAKDALKTVGLEKHIYKKPNQLSGGQMQRVAIARALINDPEIILADEPTGALDTQTSKQIMDLLSKVAKERLVIMVTHNPELASDYANRIIKLQDGKILDDTNPFDGKEKKEETKAKTKKPTMKFTTALGLSLNNLLTKKGRTILTSLAGSIGIIGIALILSLSNGFQNYIDKLQEDTLSSYPLTIASEAMDFSSFLLSMMQPEKTDPVEGKIVETQQFVSMFSNVTTNDLKSLKKHFENNRDKLEDMVTNISYTYSVDPIIYTKSKGHITQVNPNSMFQSMFGGSNMASIFSTTSSVFFQINDENVLTENYKILKGKLPENYDELVLVLPNEGNIPDLILYLLGIRDLDELYDIMGKVMSGESVDINNEPMELSYDDFLNLELKLIDNSKLYKYNKKYKIYENMQDDEKYLKDLYNKSKSLKVVGIICPKEGNSAMSAGLGYKPTLITHVIEQASKSDIVKKQISNENVDVFSNKRFDDKKANSKIKFEDMISVDTKMLQKAFKMDVDEKDIKKLTEGYMEKISSSITTDTKPVKEDLLNTIEEVSIGSFNYYLKNYNDHILSLNEVSPFISNYLETDGVKSLLKKLEKKYLIPSNVYEEMLKSLLLGLYQGYIGGYAAVDSSFTTNPANPAAPINEEIIKPTVDNFMNQTIITVTAENLASKMLEAKVKSDVLTKVGELTGELMNKIASSFNVDPNMIASAFKFNLSEKELSRLMNSMSNPTDKNAKTNLLSLGYQDIDDPTMISIYFSSFDNKENFIEFLDKYNDKATEEQKINYSDSTAILMSSVKKIVDSVSYVLIAFVSISLIVSSIMIGIITYISVLERTKEIGILRAIGASKKNISSIFNAETFIIGLLAGLIGIGVTLSLVPLINNVIHTLTKNYNINASIPIKASIILIILSIILTLIGGLIPSRLASKKDPVEALRTE